MLIMMKNHENGRGIDSQPLIVWGLKYWFK